MSGAAAFHIFFHFILSTQWLRSPAGHQVPAYQEMTVSFCTGFNTSPRLAEPSQIPTAIPATAKLAILEVLVAVLSVLYILSHLILTAAPGGIITIVILQLRKLRLKGVEYIFHSHMLGSGGFEPRQCDSYRTALSTRLC